MKNSKVLILVIMTFAFGVLIGVQISRPSKTEAARVKLRVFSDAYFGGYHDALYASRNNMLTKDIMERQHFFRALYIAGKGVSQSDIDECWNRYLTQEGKMNEE